MDFITDFLQIDYEKTIQKLCKYAEANEMYCNIEPALDALMRYRNSSDRINFAEVQFKVDKAINDSEVRKHFGINKNLNIVNEIVLLANADIGKDYGEDRVSFSSELCMKSDDIGRIEALIRSGIFNEYELTPDDFEDKNKTEKTGYNSIVYLDEDNAYIQIEFWNDLGRDFGKVNLTKDEVISLHEMIIEETHNNPTLAYRIGNDYLVSIAEYAEYEIAEDNYEYNNGLMIVYYTDETHEEKISHTCIDLDHLENHLPIGFPCKKYTFENDSFFQNKGKKKDVIERD